VDLLPEHALVKTSDLDQGAWNYHGIVGMVSRRRLHLVDRLLEGVQSGRLLEVGYGSGVFMPTLARHCTSLDGIDVHDKLDEVRRVLTEHGVEASLVRGSITELPYPDDTFDTVVCISVLEFVDDLEAGCGELSRVLSPTGRLVVVTPGHSRVLDTGLRLLTGERAADTFAGRRQRILPALVDRFDVDRRLSFPPAAPAVLRLYTALSLRSRRA
jgi:ubiquinone/menaquinone biosynthesis C-methylase UbiE